MAIVETARGPLPVEQLGKVLMHEHVFVISTEMQQNKPEEWGDEDARVADAVARLSALKAAGIDAIVDPTAIGLGRHIPRIVRVAEQLDLHIVVATGLYAFDTVGFYWKDRRPGSGPSGADPMVEFFVRDIDEGIAATNVKAGVIKCATDRPGLTQDVERVLRACAQAHRRTGVPITTHTNAPQQRGLDQQRIFKEEGVDLRRVVIGHCGDTADLDYLESLLREGSTLGMDRFGIDGYLTTDKRVDVVAELCNRGYADQLVLSHDFSCYIDWFPGEFPPSTMPNWNYLHISHDVLPALVERGVAQAQIDAMLIHNPARLLVRGAPY